MLRRLTYFFGYLRTILILNIKNIKYGKYPLIIGQNPLITNKGDFKVGHSFRIRSSQFKTQITCCNNAELEIGHDVYINQGTNIYCSKSIKIGNNVAIADLVMISDTNFHEIEESEPIRIKPIIIDDNVWIGARSIILPGVEIGKNSVIGAGSVVTKSIPSNTLAVGVPAKIIKQLKPSKDYIRQ